MALIRAEQTGSDSQTELSNKLARLMFKRIFKALASLFLQKKVPLVGNDQADSIMCPNIGLESSADQTGLGRFGTCQVGIAGPGKDACQNGRQDIWLHEHPEEGFPCCKAQVPIVCISDASSEPVRRPERRRPFITSN